MNDLISRNEAAKRLEDLAKKREGSFSGEAFEFAAKVVRGVPAADVPHWATEQAYKNGYEQGMKDALKWITVTERLPEESGEYLVYCGEYDGICVLYYEILKTKGKWRTQWKQVTHWMPLPKLPKGE